MDGVILDELDRWVRGEYYRDVLVYRVNGGVERFLVLNKPVFMRLYSKYQSGVFGKAGLYASVYSHRQQQQKRYDTLFLDIDVHIDASLPTILDAAYRKMKKVISKLKENGIEHYRIYFTGRGFHVYVDFPEIEIRRFRKVALEFIRIIGIEKYVDTRTIGDSSRVARLPYTVNQEVGLYVIPVTEDMGFRGILEASTKMKPFKIEYNIPQNQIVAGMLQEIDEKIGEGGEASTGEYEPGERYSYFGVKRRFYELPRCVQNAVKQLMLTGELDHYQRLFLAQCLLRMWGYEDTVSIFKLAGDYKPGKTLYQLDYIVETRQKPYKCRRVKEELGLCPYEDQRRCPFYPWIEIWLPSWDTVFEKIEKEKELVYNREFGQGD